MGWCHEFGPAITPGCDHPMVAAEDSCHCSECGVVCVGRFAACADVWEARVQPVVIGRQPLPSSTSGEGDPSTNGTAAAAHEAIVPHDELAEAMEPRRVPAEGAVQRISTSLRSAPSREAGGQRSRRPTAGSERRTPALTEDMFKVLLDRIDAAVFSMGRLLVDDEEQRLRSLLDEIIARVDDLAVGYPTSGSAHLNHPAGPGGPSPGR